MARSLRKRHTRNSSHDNDYWIHGVHCLCLYPLYTHWWSVESWCHYIVLWLLTVHPLDTRLGLAWCRHGLVSRCIAGPGKWITGVRRQCVDCLQWWHHLTLLEDISWLWLQSMIRIGDVKNWTRTMTGVGVVRGWGEAWPGRQRREACIYWSFKSRDGSILEYLLNRI